MKININHKTIYNYSDIVPRLIQSVRLFPTECTNQKTIKWSIKSSKGVISESHQDSLGHRIFSIYNKNLVGTQTIVSRGTIETKDTSGVLKGLKEKINPLCFARNTELTYPCKKIIKLSKKLNKCSEDDISFCHKMNDVVSKSIKYVSGSTTVYTSAQKSIEQGKGVCQDFAHILISLARFYGFPARYINGFLFEEGDSFENSTHAWVEIFITDLGWVGFDPTQNKCTDEKYIRLCCGLDFLDASLIKGVKTNFNGVEDLKVDVSIDSCQ